MSRRTAACVALALLLLGLDARGALAAAEDPDWPCVQRLVPKIAPGMIWAGPPIEEPAGAHADPEVERLAAELAARRVPLEDAERAIADFADGLAPADRDAVLTHLFARALAIINHDRGSIIRGIKKYDRGQRALAAQIAAKNAHLAELPADQILERDALAAERDWDIRIYDDRRQSLSYLCEQPVLLEQRAFAIARAIAERLQ